MGLVSMLPSRSERLGKAYAPLFRTKLSKKVLVFSYTALNLNSQVAKVRGN